MWSLLKRIHRTVVVGEPYTALFEWLKGRWEWLREHPLWPAALAVMTAFWTWIVSTIQAIHALGWGIWFVLGLLLAFLSLLAVALWRTNVGRRAAHRERDARSVGVEAGPTGTPRTNLDGGEARARLALKSRLGELLADLDDVTTPQAGERWERRARDLIRGAFGPGEDRSFSIRGPAMDEPLWSWQYRFIRERQARLGELMRRVDHLPLEPGFIERFGAGSEPQTRADARPDMTMRSALYWLAGVTTPDALVSDLVRVPRESWQAAALALREAAYRGDIRVWGRVSSYPAPRAGTPICWWRSSRSTGGARG